MRAGFVPARHEDCASGRDSTERIGYISGFAYMRRIIGRTLIEANTPDSRTSTTGEVVGGAYVFIGNSQIDRMNQRQLDAATMQPIRMYRVPVPGSRP